MFKVFKFKFSRFSTTLIFPLSYLNDKMMKGMILIDVQKAFETTDHDILLQKFHAIGLPKHTADWFKSYLSNI